MAPLAPRAAFKVHSEDKIKVKANIVYVNGPSALIEV